MTGLEDPPPPAPPPPVLPLTPLPVLDGGMVVGVAPVVETGGVVVGASSNIIGL